MTCENCIHYRGKHSLCEKWILYSEKICKHFENNDGSYENGSWHCHRCGKAITCCGLCSDCEKKIGASQTRPIQR